MSKPILCIDFDGVLHSYTTPWVNATTIPDPPVLGAIQFLLDAEPYFRIAVFSSRSHQSGGIDAMRAWLAYHIADYFSSMPLALQQITVDQFMAQIEWPTAKPPALVTLDDRAVTFTGVWPTISQLQAFKPWNR